MTANKAFTEQFYKVESEYLNGSDKTKAYRTLTLKPECEENVVYLDAQKFPDSQNQTYLTLSPCLGDKALNQCNSTLIYFKTCGANARAVSLIPRLLLSLPLLNFKRCCSTHIWSPSIMQS
ncbi:hypothetical protein ACTXT7_009069 [Hymenolepis weldensis]